MATRTAARDDQPFDFNLDAVQAEVDLSPWRVHWAGRRWEFAHMQALNVWELVEAAEAGDTQAMVGIFKAALGGQWQDFHATPLPQYKLRALFDAYRRHSGLEPGESGASAS
ncbi:hypothetical protein [Streptomyces abikoensis]|uniref:Uncharacterized protein n=1 Tax=Streptomyces abikoensis TaxID=97398 RepID=A0ABW7TC26_9ACTN|nr:hypothetical protein [Streptomyces abikoensis]GGP56060.1 hypothetical protein GCM10010214_31600 [Streptomyces abikoensis]